MVEVEVFDVVLRQRVSTDGSEVTNAVILLKEADGSRLLPIWIGEAEATALALELQGVKCPRPLTYNFTASLLDAAGVNVKSVAISRLVKDTFYATVSIQRGRTQAAVDARPSDAVNIALRTGAPIFAEERVLKKSSVSVRVTKAERAGSAALVQRFEERARIANKVLGEAVHETQHDLPNLGFELVREKESPGGC